MYHNLANKLAKSDDVIRSQYGGVILWSIVLSGKLLASDDHSLGHGFSAQDPKGSVYVTPKQTTAVGYARPHVVFGDGVYHRVFLEVLVDPVKRKTSHCKSGKQWVAPEHGIVIRAIWIQANSPVHGNDDRLETWEPSLEAIPPGRSLRVVQPELIIISDDDDSLAPKRRCPSEK